MAEKTKKELRELNEVLQEEKIAVVEQYNVLLGEAQAVQQVARERLVLLRLLEAFANETNGALNKLRNDIAELQIAPVNEEREATGGEL